jgi:acetyl esterase/lipase
MIRVGKSVLCLAVALFAGLQIAVAQEKAPQKALPDGVTVHRDLEYGTHERNKLDIYMPVKNGETAPPLVIWIHGGGWQGGSKEGGATGAIVGKGYAVASINYRYSQQAAFPAQIHDCKSAVRWLRAHAKEYGYDTSRIGAWGASAGGHLCALLATTGGMSELEGNGGNKNQSSRVDAIIDWFGPTDFLNWGKDGFPAPSNTAGNAISKLFGGSVVEKGDLAKLASPVCHISRDTPPILLVHGDQDNLVPLQQSEVFFAKLKQAKVDVTLHVVKGGGHGQGFGKNEADVCFEFLERTLKKK